MSFDSYLTIGLKLYLITESIIYITNSYKKVHKLVIN